MSGWHYCVAAWILQYFFSWKSPHRSNACCLPYYESQSLKDQRLLWIHREVCEVCAQTLVSTLVTGPTQIDQIPHLALVIKVPLQNVCRGARTILETPPELHRAQLAILLLR